MKIRQMTALMALSALVSCSEADAEKAPKVEETKEVNLVGYWESSTSIDGKPLYLQFMQDGTAKHNRSFMVTHTNWMFLANKKQLIFTAGANNLQYKCDVDVDENLIVVKDAACLPKYSDIEGLEGASVRYIKQ